MNARAAERKAPETADRRRIDYITLNSQNEGQRVVVVPDDEDRFVLSVRDAAAACQRHLETTAWQAQFEELLNRFGRWLSDHADKVHRAYVTLRDGGLFFLVIRNSVPFDEEIEDSLTDLDVSVAQDDSLSLISLNVMALPLSSRETYRTFLAEPFVWAYGAE